MPSAAPTRDIAFPPRDGGSGQASPRLHSGRWATKIHFSIHPELLQRGAFTRNLASAAGPSRHDLGFWCLMDVSMRPPVVDINKKLLLIVKGYSWGIFVQNKQSKSISHDIFGCLKEVLQLSWKPSFLQMSGTFQRWKLVFQGYANQAASPRIGRQASMGSREEFLRSRCNYCGVPQAQDLPFCGHCGHQAEARCLRIHQWRYYREINMFF